MKRVLLYCVFLFFSSHILVRAQTTYGSEEELKKEATTYFKEENYTEAAPLFSQLLSLYPKDPTYNYKYGVCILYTDPSKSLTYLEFASRTPSDNKDIFYYLGRSYHLNYFFDKAIIAFEKYKTTAKKNDIDKYGIDRQIEMCKNGRELVKSMKKMEVIDKKDVAKEAFYTGYNISKYGGKILAMPENFKTDLDKKKKESSTVFLSKEYKIAYFSSYGEDGKHGKDIYKIIQLPDGEWGTPENLGTVVNTDYDEAFPFMHSDGKTLYFCSKGFNSMGGYDIFKTRYNGISWSQPENIGFPINSPANDIFYVTDSNLVIATFASDRESLPGQIKVYYIDISATTNTLALIRGKFVSGVQPNAREAKITVFNAQSNELIGTYDTDPQTGGYEITIPLGVSYKFVVEAEGFLPHSENVTIPSKVKASILRQEIKMKKNEISEQMIISNSFIEETELSIAAQETSKETVQQTINMFKYEDKDKLEAVQINGETIYVTPPSDITESRTVDNDNIVATTESDQPSIEKEEVEDTELAQIVENKPTTTFNKDLTNKDIVRIAYEEAEVIGQEAKVINVEAKKTFHYAQERDSLSKVKLSESERLTEESQHIVDESQKQQKLAEANRMKEEGEEMAKEADLSYVVAKELGQTAHEKLAEAKQALESAKKTEVSAGTKTPEESRTIASQLTVEGKEEKEEYVSVSAYQLLRNNGDKRKQEALENKLQTENKISEGKQLQEEYKDITKEKETLLSTLSDNTDPEEKLLIQQKADSLDVLALQKQKEAEQAFDKASNLQAITKQQHQEAELAYSLAEKFKNMQETASVISGEQEPTIVSSEQSIDIEAEKETKPETALHTISEKEDTRNKVEQMDPDITIQSDETQNTEMISEKTEDKEPEPVQDASQEQVSLVEGLLDTPEEITTAMQKESVKVETQAKEKQIDSEDLARKSMELRREASSASNLAEKSTLLEESNRLNLESIKKQQEAEMDLSRAQNLRDSAEIPEAQNIYVKEKERASVHPELIDSEQESITEKEEMSITSKSGQESIEKITDDGIVSTVSAQKTETKETNITTEQQQTHETSQQVEDILQIEEKTTQVNPSEQIQKTSALEQTSVITGVNQPGTEIVSIMQREADQLETESMQSQSLSEELARQSMQLRRDAQNISDPDEKAAAVVKSNDLNKQSIDIQKKAERKRTESQKLKADSKTYEGQQSYLNKTKEPAISEKQPELNSQPQASSVASIDETEHHIEGQQPQAAKETTSLVQKISGQVETTPAPSQETVETDISLPDPTVADNEQQETGELLTQQNKTRLTAEMKQQEEQVRMEASQQQNESENLARESMRLRMEASRTGDPTEKKRLLDKSNQLNLQSIKKQQEYEAKYAKADELQLLVNNPEALASYTSTSGINVPANPDETGAVGGVTATPVSTSEPGSAATINYSSASVFASRETSVYNISAPIPIDQVLPEGLLFKVQIGAFRNPIPQDLFKGLQPLAGERTASGITKYTAGLFKAFETADLAKLEIRDMGYSDAFIVAYYNGKRISISEARTIMNRNTPEQKQAYDVVASQEFKALRAVNIYPQKFGLRTPSLISASTPESSPVPAITETTTSSESAGVSTVQLGKRQGLIYTVQVGVYRTSDFPIVLTDLQPVNKDQLSNGLYRYTSGFYTAFNSADRARQNIASQFVPDAFVIAFYNGKKISVNEAKEMGRAESIEKPSVLVSEQNVVSNDIPVQEEAISSGAIDPAALVFKIQVGAFKEKVPVNYVDLYFSIIDKGISSQVMPDGMTAFYAGSMNDYTSAELLRDDIIKAGLKDAFIVAFNGKQKISVEEARKMLGQ